MKTTIYKGQSGWTANSMTEADANGNAWQISTNKTRAGIIRCSAVQGKVIGSGCFSYDMFGAKRLDLASTPGQCTEKAVRLTHELGLLKFSALIEQTPEIVKPSYIIEVGQIIFTDGPFDSSRRVVYEIPEPGEYKTVSLDGLDLGTEDRINPFSEKFGIGVYYNEGEILPLDEIQPLVDKAIHHQKNQREKMQAASDKAAIEKAEKIAIGAQIISAVPVWAQSVIVAELRENRSDTQSDYYAHETVKTVFLSWSKHTRDIFSELRKAAGRLEDTKIYEHAPQKPEDANEYWTAPDEHREKYSMGEGYYLGESSYHGWIIKKRSYDLANSKFIEVMQVAAAENRFLCSDVIEEEKSVPEIQDGSVKIIEHPFRAGKILVIGETRPIKEALKAAGGWWNRFEKAWEYKAEKTQELVGLLQNLSANV